MTDWKPEMTPVERQKVKKAAKPKKKRKDTPKSLKAKADRLCGAIVRARGACERCGGPGSEHNPLQWCHIRSRHFNATRCDPTNAWCLCAGCHLVTGLDPAKFMDLVEKTIGRAAYDELFARSQVVTRGTITFWRGEIARLEGERDAQATVV